MGSAKQMNSFRGRARFRQSRIVPYAHFLTWESALHRPLTVRPCSNLRMRTAIKKSVFPAHLGKSLFKLDIFVSMRVAHRIRHQLERHGFEVCSRLADRLGMRARPVRLFFIYISFFSLGIGFAVYLILAFWLRLKDLVYAKRTSVFDL